MTLDLTQDDQLKQAVDSINPLERNPDWLQSLEQLLSYVKQIDIDARKTKDFHERIWDHNAVSSVGMGTVDISAAIENSGFRGWLAEESVKPLGDSAEARMTRLRSLHDEIIDRLKEFSNRTPRVKILRVLAALYPHYFTTITNGRMALVCHRALFGKRKKPDAIRRQIEIRERLDQVLGSCGDSSGELAERMTIAWFVFKDHVQSEGGSDDTAADDPLCDEALKPLPALQRRKGITSIKGGLSTISSALSFVSDGVTREDLLDYLRAEFPDYRDSSLRTLINILKNEFYVVQEVDGTISPTVRGELFFESGDPQELIPQFLTRTLGVDHVLLALAKAALSPKNNAGLLAPCRAPWWHENPKPDQTKIITARIGCRYPTDTGRQ